MSQGFQELSQGLSIFSEQKIEPKIVAPSLDYTNLSKNLSVFESFNEEQSLFNTLLGRHHKKTSTGGEFLSSGYSFYFDLSFLNCHSIYSGNPLFLFFLYWCF